MEKVLIILFKTIIVISVSFIFIGSFFSCNSCEMQIKKQELNDKYSGYVIYKYLDTGYNGRSQPRIVLGDSKSYDRNVYAVRNIFMYNNIDSGDYVYKDAGSLKRFLVKGNDTIMYYPQCGDGNDVRD